jgi:hypothetical protein
MRMKLKYGELLSSFAFKSNLRCYITVEALAALPEIRELETMTTMEVNAILVKLTPEAASQALAALPPEQAAQSLVGHSPDSVARMMNSMYPSAVASVGRCRLTVSKPALKARLVSALETKR